MSPRTPGRAPRHRLSVALVSLLAAVVVSACGDSAAADSPPSRDVVATSAGPPAWCAASTLSIPSVAQPDDWPTFARSAQRDAAAGGGALAATPAFVWGAAVGGQVLAQPVVAGRLAVVATEADRVEALDTDTGCLVWSSQVGAAVPAQGLACPLTYLGDTIGITATPVIDLDNGVVDVVAYVQPTHHELIALDLATGSIRGRVAIDPVGTQPDIQLSRGALALTSDSVLAVSGGRAGDCGDYRGWVVAASRGGSPTVTATWQAPGGRAGVWSPAGVMVLPSGDVMFSTGNGASTDVYDSGNSVVRLGPHLAPLDSFAPSDWADLTARDFDLGSTTPVLVGGRVLAIGKGSTAYLLDPGHLGGMGGSIASVSIPKCYAIGALAVEGDVAYLPCDHGVAAVRVAGDTVTTLWRGPDDRAGSPVVAYGAVWSIDFEHGAMQALDPDTGAVQFTVEVGSASHFVAPTPARGLMLIPAGDHVEAVRVAASSDPVAVSVGVSG